MPVYTVAPKTQWSPSVTVAITLVGRDDEGRMVCAYVVEIDNQPVMGGSDLRSGCHMPATETTMFASLCSFLGAYGESLYHSGERSEWWEEFAPVQRDFLMSYYEDFGMASAELAA
jgi:hypothetical protein